MATSTRVPDFVIPDGYAPPLAIVSDSDHTAWIYVATALGLAVTLCFGAIRTLVRKTICPGVGLDDILVAVSTLIAVFQACVVLAASANGLGRSTELMSPNAQVKAQKLYYASILLFVIALGLSKLSVIFFLLRLTSVNFHKRLFHGASALTAAWAIGSFLLMAFKCDLTHPWIVSNVTCSGSYLRWQIICAFDAAIELVIVGMATLLVWNLQTSVSRKAAVLITFAFRLVLVIPIAFRLATFQPEVKNIDFFLAEALFAVWTQTQLNYSIISATIPTIRIFATSLNTQFGGLTEGERADYSGSYEVKSTQSRVFSAGDGEQVTASTDTKEIRKETSATSLSRFTGQQNRYTYDVSALSALSNVESKKVVNARGAAEKVDGIQLVPMVASGRASSDNSQEMMIRREIAYDVKYID